ncbi:type II toxin-antitoxin system Phd/YefM family antitoxin [Sphaerimonospora cavernae]|uniref:Antitoxin n=1 Tax=Sphaerimonospora cavernae TaxID=1740611 RepID=A0ABV6U0V6_9ACTN
MEIEQIGIVEARKRLGTLVSRAVHAHTPVRISRSAEENAVLISEDDYAEFRRLREQAEVVEFKERIAKAERGETPALSFTDADDMFRHFGVTRDGQEL